MRASSVELWVPSWLHHVRARISEAKPSPLWPGEAQAQGPARPWTGPGGSLWPVRTQVLGIRTPFLEESLSELSVWKNRAWSVGQRGSWSILCGKDIWQVCVLYHCLTAIQFDHHYFQTPENSRRRAFLYLWRHSRGGLWHQWLWPKGVQMDNERTEQRGCFKAFTKSSGWHVKGVRTKKWRSEKNQTVRETVSSPWRWAGEVSSAVSWGDWQVANLFQALIGNVVKPWSKSKSKVWNTGWL